jgi:hypothetical protein
MRHDLDGVLLTGVIVAVLPANLGDGQFGDQLI